MSLLKEYFSKYKILSDKIHEQALYDDITQEDKDLLKIYDEINYCKEEFIYANINDWYKNVALYVKNRGFETVIDIGACYGFQAENFINENLNYIGVECVKYMKDYQFMKDHEKVTYILKKYPCEIEIPEKSVLVSNLCIGYLVNEEAFEEMNKTFQTVILNNKCKGLEKYYPVITELKNEKYGDTYIFDK